MTRRIVFDFETRSEISVVDAGAWKYGAHPSTEILCAGWSTRDAGPWSPVRVAIVCGGSDGRAAVERRVRERGVEVATVGDFVQACEHAEILVAHNVGFEQAVMLHPLRTWGLPQSRIWSCTASRARRLGIPGALEGACNVMRTPHRKSVEGHRIMLQVSQPRPLWANRRLGPQWFDDSERLAACAVYCAEDILAERDLDDVLPELPPFERTVWEQVERANRMGLCLDVELIGAMERAVDGEEERVLEEVRRVLGNPGFSLTAPATVRALCAQWGTDLPDLQAATVEQVLAQHRSGAKPVHDVVRMVLEGRQLVGKSSNAKLPAMRDRLQEDGRARDYAIYHGAHTGRQTGSKVNPLNFPRPYRGYDQEQVLPILREGRLKDLKVSPSLAVSASLRGTIVAPPGKKFAIGDYTSIEPCVLFTLAEQWDAIEVLVRSFSGGPNLYVDMARAVFGRPVTKKDIREYTVGKVIILALGYGMYPAKFYTQLRAAGIDCTEDDAVAWRQLYLSRFPRVPELWAGLEEAQKQAIRNPHKRYAYGAISYIFDGWWLVCTLPSGRPLFYPDARLQPGRFGDDIVYQGRLVGGAWGDVRTWGGTSAENMAQSISRDVTVEDKLDVERRYGWHVPLDVYDEIVAECPAGEQGALDRLLAVMRQRRPWLPRMPVWAEGFEATRYRKD